MLKNIVYVTRKTIFRRASFSPRFLSNNVSRPNIVFTYQQPDLELDSREIREVDRLYNGLVYSNRACLAQSITLIESTHARKRLQSRLLLSKALQYCQSNLSENTSTGNSFRIGKLNSSSINVISK